MNQEGPLVPSVSQQLHACMVGNRKEGVTRLMNNTNLHNSMGRYAAYKCTQNKPGKCQGRQGLHKMFHEAMLGGGCGDRAC